MLLQYVWFRRLASALPVIFLSAGLSGCGPGGSDVDANVASDEAMAEMTPLERGRNHYVRYCASCHGPDGLGDGPVAEALKDVPTDITHFRSDNSGDFPVDVLIDIIRGNKDVRAHGTREMPVWGNIWDTLDSKAAEDAVVQARINELVEYIRSIQK